MKVYNVVINTNTPTTTTAATLQLGLLVPSLALILVYIPSKERRLVVIGQLSTHLVEPAGELRQRRVGIYSE